MEKSNLLPVDGTKLSFYTTNDDNGWGFVITDVGVDTEGRTENGFAREEEARNKAIKNAEKIAKI